MKRKIQNKGFLAFLILAFIISIGYPFLKAFYREPITWKEEVRKGTLRKHPKLEKENVDLYVDCLFQKFNKSYGRVRKFPNRANYTIQDKRNIVDCTIEFLILDSIQKQNAIELRDSIANQL